MSLYRKIFSQSWKITWHRKYLWFFGLFSILLVGSGAETGVFNKVMGGDWQEVFLPWRTIWNALAFSSNSVGGVDKLASNDPFYFVTALFVLFVVVLLALFITWLAVVSQTALVNNVALEATGRDNDLKTGVLAGVEKFWPVVGFNILDKLVIGLCSLFISLPVVFGGEGLVGNSQFIFVVLFIVFVPVALVFSLIVKYAICFSVIKKRRFWQSISDGWKLFLDNWIISVEMVASLFVLSFLFAIGIIIALLVLMIPFMLVGFVLFYITQSSLLAGIALILALIFLFAAIVVTGSAFFTFQMSAWTNMFIQLTGQGGTAKIVRLMDKVMK